MANAYAHESEDFSGKSNTSSLDVWVFEKVVEFLHRNGKAIANNDRMVFFLHLLGLDTGLYFYPLNFRKYRIFCYKGNVITELIHIVCF